MMKKIAMTAAVAVAGAAAGYAAFAPAEAEAQVWYPVPVATMCVTPVTACPIPPGPVGYSCWCPTPYGPAWGYSR